MTETAPAPAYKDRKVWLVIFGILTLLAGLGCALLGASILLAASFGVHHPDPTHPPMNAGFLSAIYFGPAVLLVWLGIGSIMARRWARALLVIWSWSWFAIGLVAIAGAAIFLPTAMARLAIPARGGAPIPEGTRVMILTVILLFYAVFLVCVPLIWGLFYSGKNVKATCEARDPVTRWTDRCPLPVLAASLWLACGVLSLLAMPAFHSIAFFFGIFLTGAAGMIYYLVVALIWLYTARALYRLEPRGWWIALIGSILFWLSTAITYARHDFAEVYARMGYTPAQIESLHFMNALQRGPMVCWTLLLSAPFLAYLLWIRKFFRQPAAS